MAKEATPKDEAAPRIVAAAGSTSLNGQRGLRSKLLARAQDDATAAYLKEIEDYNKSLKPEDFIDEAGQVITGFIDPKRYRKVDHKELRDRKIAARAAAKKALNG